MRAPKPGVPLVAFSMKAEKRTHGYNEFDIADRLRQFGWVVPVRACTPFVFQDDEIYWKGFMR